MFLAVFSLGDCFLFCSPSMPTNNDGKDLACSLDERLTHSQPRLSVSFLRALFTQSGLIKLMHTCLILLLLSYGFFYKNMPVVICIYMLIKQVAVILTSHFTSLSHTSQQSVDSIHLQGQTEVDEFEGVRAAFSIHFQWEWKGTLNGLRRSPGVRLQQIQLNAKKKRGALFHCCSFHCCLIRSRERQDLRSDPCNNSRAITSISRAITVLVLHHHT